MRSRMSDDGAPLAGLRAQRRLDHAHDQRAGHALARDVGDRGEDAVVGVHQVEVVAADLLRRLVEAEDLEVLPARERARQVAALDLAGQRQFLLERGAAQALAVQRRGAHRRPGLVGQRLEQEQVLAQEAATRELLAERDRAEHLVAVAHRHKSEMSSVFAAPMMRAASSARSAGQPSAIWLASVGPGPASRRAARGPRRPAPMSAGERVADAHAARTIERGDGDEAVGLAAEQHAALEQQRLAHGVRQAAGQRPRGRAR